MSRHHSPAALSPCEIMLLVVGAVLHALSCTRPGDDRHAAPDPLYGFTLAFVQALCLPRL